MQNKMITLCDETLRISQEVSDNFRRSASHKNGGFSWWVRQQLKLYDQGEDLVEMKLQVSRNFSACHRLAGLIELMHNELYPDKEFNKELIVAHAINQRDITEWIE